MSELSISVNATDALKKLEALASRVEQSEPIVENLSNEMAENIKHNAKINCPSDTGNLQESIDYRGSYPSYEFVADAVNSQGQKYGVFVEFGTSKMEPRPFLEPSVDEGVRDYKVVVKEEILRFLRGK
jgi:HK97 gp10 family phage protein